ncbi:MAG: DUF1801 domain-containing protein [Acidobacteriota bacterium]
MATRSRYSNFNDVDEYLLALDERRRSSLEKLRAIIRRVAPQAREVMRFNMPYYEYNGMLCAFSALENQLRFYLHEGLELENFQPELSGIEIRKGCIRFQDISEIPESLIERIVKEAVLTSEQLNNQTH